MPAFRPRETAPGPPTAMPDDLSVSLSAFLDGELDPAAAREIEERLQHDPELRRRYDLLRASSSWLATVCEPDPGFVVRWRDRREALSFVPRWTWRQLGFRLAAAAAVTLVAGGLSLFWQTAPGAGAVSAEGVEDAPLVGTGEPPADQVMLALEGQILGGSDEDSAILDGWFAAGEPATGEADARYRDPVLVIALGDAFPVEGE